MEKYVVEKLVKEYGSPLYVFDVEGFRENYKKLDNIFKNYYEKYQISYSLKTNYTPYIVKTVKKLGGYAEVVSGMEYFIAKKVGYSDNQIIYNGPNKKDEEMNVFLAGCILNADSVLEVERLSQFAKKHSEHKFEIGIRVNLNVGQNFVSRFGIDPIDLDYVFQIVKKIPNLEIIGLQCHISRCRGLEAWEERTKIMLSLADKYFNIPPKFIDLGSGMFGEMDPEFAAQFQNVPTYEEYAKVTALQVAKHYQNINQKPMLITEPGTTLVNKFIDFISRVDVIKKVCGEYFAVLNCSEHNLGETCILKELPIVILNNNEGKHYNKIHFSGYTCLEQDVMRKNVECNLAVGDSIVFGNVGGYSNVLKPPFIWPNCRMIAFDSILQKAELIKEAERYEDLLNTYIF